MKKYWEEKLKVEYKTLTDIWDITLANWKSDTEDIENIYRIRVPMVVVALICRRLMEQCYLANNENSKYENKYKDISVRILINKTSKNSVVPSFYKNIEKMQYPDTFVNKIESSVDLYEICNYLIHERTSSYADDMVSYDNNGNKFIKGKNETSIFYCVDTHNLRVRMNKDNFPKISWFLQRGDEKESTVLVDIKSLIAAFGECIKIYTA